MRLLVDVPCKQQRVADGYPRLFTVIGQDGANLGAAEIHQHAHTLSTAGFLLGAADIGNHGLPSRLIIMRTVNANALDAVLHQRLNHAGILGSLSRQRHHDTGIPPVLAWAEDLVRLAGDRMCAIKEALF